MRVIRSFVAAVLVLVGWVGNAQATGIVIDNTLSPAGAFSDSGGWAGFGGTLPTVNGAYQYNGNNSSTATYKPGVVGTGFTNGVYGVYGQWAVNGNHSAVARYTVNYVGGSSSSGVNEQQNAAQGEAGAITGAGGAGSGYYYLGTFNMDSNSTVVLSDDGDGNSLVADAVMFRDDGRYYDPQSTNVTATLARSGIYRVADAPAGNCVNWTAKASPSLTWANLAYNGAAVYDVQVSWQQGSGSSSVTYWVDANGNDAQDAGEVFTKNQSTGSGWSGFVDLGNFTLTANAKMVQSISGTGNMSAGPTLVTYVSASVPTVSLVTPTNNQAFSIFSSVSATATVSGGVSPYTVKFYTNSNAGAYAQAGGDDTEAPYEVNLGTPAAGPTYHIYATVTDNVGSNAVSATNAFTVANLPPSVAITSPVNDANFSPGGAITIQATATDDSAITNVDFYAGVSLLGSTNGSPYDFTWNGVAAGEYALTAVAWDDSGQSATSAVVNITVSNAPPSVAIISPVNGANFGQGESIAIEATATDESAITNVDFYAGATWIGNDDTGPAYAYSWDGAAGGAYALTAVAWDDSGQSATSAAVNISVVMTEINVTTNIVGTFNQAGYTLSVGNLTNDIVVTIGTNSGFYNVGNVTIGAAGRTNNRIIMSGAGAVWTNVPNTTIRFLGSDHVWSISNGAVFSVTSGGNGTINADAFGTRNTIIVSGTGSLFKCRNLTMSGNMRNVVGCSIIVGPGAEVSASSTQISSKVGDRENSVLVSGEGARIALNNWSGNNFGAGGSSNSITVSQGGTVTMASIAMTSGNYVSNNITVTDPGSVLTNNKNGNSTYGFYFAGSGGPHKFTVSNGGRYTLNSTIASIFGGAGSLSNTIEVTGSGSTWDQNGQAFTIGNDVAATGNEFNVYSAGKFDNAGVVTLGGVDSTFNLGDGINVSTARVSAINLSTDSALLTFNKGLLEGSTDGNLIYGSGSISNAGLAQVRTLNTAYTNTISCPMSGPGGFQKLGNGTLVLASTNTYSGETRVIWGTLRLTGTDTLSTATKVYLTTATPMRNLDLDYEGTAIVSGLSIDGVTQPNGVYGANGTTITGTGYLSVGKANSPTLLLIY